MVVIFSYSVLPPDEEEDDGGARGMRDKNAKLKTVTNHIYEVIGPMMMVAFCTKWEDDEDVEE